MGRQDLAERSNIRAREARRDGGTRNRTRNVGTATDDIAGEFAHNEDWHCGERTLIVISWIFFMIFFPISLFATLMVSQAYERVVVLRLGKVRGGVPKGPGLVFFLPCIDTPYVVDLRLETLAILPQEVLSKDSCTVTVDAVVYFRIINPVAAIVAVYNYKKATVMMAASVLRNVVGQENILDIFSERTKLAREIHKILEVQAHPWGVLIHRVEMMEVSIPVTMQRAMAAEAEATRDARAKIIVAEGELKAAQAMKEAAETIQNNNEALHLRYIQTLESIKNERTQTFVFPIPTTWIEK